MYVHTLSLSLTRTHTYSLSHMHTHTPPLSLTHTHIMHYKTMGQLHMTQTGATPGERCAACTPAIRTRLDCQSDVWHHHIISQPWVLQISCCQSSSNFKNDVKWLPIVLLAEQSVVFSHLGMGKCKCSEKSEMRMTASALKQDPNTWKVKTNAI